MHVLQRQICLCVKRTQATTRDLDRLATLGLAAGKDFNDELTLIVNYADLSLREVGAAHPATEWLKELSHAAMRCAETARCLLVVAERSRESIQDRVREGYAHPGN